MGHRQFGSPPTDEDQGELMTKMVPVNPTDLDEASELDARWYLDARIHNLEERQRIVIRGAMAGAFVGIILAFFVGFISLISDMKLGKATASGSAIGAFSGVVTFFSVIVLSDGDAKNQGRTSVASIAGKIAGKLEKPASPPVPAQPESAAAA